MLLIPLKKSETETFIHDTQEAFQKGYEDYFGKSDSVIIPEKDILQSLNADGCHAFLAYEDNLYVGGVAVIIDEKTQCNHLDLLYVKTGMQSKGAGFKIWDEIERLFPKTKVWRTCTPYFDRRNIHFYVNKCHFHIVEFTNSHHQDPSMPEDFIGDGDEGMFEFEKVMK